MQKKLTVFVAVASVAIVAYFVYRIVPGPCDNILDQTAPQLRVSVDAIKAQGGLVIGQEKVQDISDEVRKAGAQLKLCCVSRQQNFITEEQYTDCLNPAKNYETKIIQVTNIITEAQAAKQEGKTELADQKAAEAKTAVGESANVVGKLAAAAEIARKLKEAAARKLADAKKWSLASGGKQYFFDEFKGKT